MSVPSCVLFSDLDGALLDEKTYAWEEARGTVSKLKDEGVPLIFVSSKTRAEIEHVRGELGIRDPFSSENGALIVVEGESRTVLGRSAEELAQAIGKIGGKTSAKLEPLSTMNRARIFETTGLQGKAADRAVQREFSQPFVLLEGSLEKVREAAGELDLRVIPGKRFHHLVGRHDKGDAVRKLRETYPFATSIGIGDGPNDVSLLREVGNPIFLGEDRPDGLPLHTHFETETGPSAWARSVESVMLRLSI